MTNFIKKNAHIWLTEADLKKNKNKLHHFSLENCNQDIQQFILMKKVKLTKALLHKYNQGRCTPAEKALVESWFLSWKEKGKTPSKEEIEQAGITIFKKLPEPATPQKAVVNWSIRIAITAAAVIAIISVGTYFFKTELPLPPTYANDINPGGNKATLTFTSGQTIPLDSSKTGILIGNDLKYNDNTLLNSTSKRSLPYSREDGEVQTITASTPTGGTYQLTLADGTKVWLNAASSLTFPSNFRSQKRQVKLSGEAYFEVAKNRKQPFIVTSTGQEITVLGTHFNVSAYSDENYTKTTLLEGSVKVNTAILKPSQQSTLSSSGIQVAQVNPALAIAWKNGEFMFRNEPLENIMQKIARWYNAEIHYQNNQVRNRQFGGSVSRFGKVSEVLCMLELTGKVHFKIEGRRITVMD